MLWVEKNSFSVGYRPFGVYASMRASTASTIKAGPEHSQEAQERSRGKLPHNREGQRWRTHAIRARSRYQGTLTLRLMLGEWCWGTGVGELVLGLHVEVLGFACWGLDSICIAAFGFEIHE